MLKQELDTEVIPVIAVRDTNRSGVRTFFLTALSYGLDSVMLVWGDRYVDGEGSANVYDYPSLSDAIREIGAWRTGRTSARPSSRRSTSRPLTRRRAPR